MVDTDGAPYRALVAAVLRQAVSDAQGDDFFYAPEAQRFLCDREDVGVWIALCGAEVDSVWRRLLYAAGLTSQPHDDVPRCP